MEQVGIIKEQRKTAELALRRPRPDDGI